jgi:purine-nucleoside phosphorylase
MNSAQAAIDTAFSLADTLRNLTQIQDIDAAVVCGSGLSSIADHLDEVARFHYDEIGLPTTKVPGHRSELIIARLNGGHVAVFAGRVHLYEGWSVHDVCAQVRMACAWGARGVLLTNAAGGINSAWHPGDLIMIEDHINLTGANPLAGVDAAPHGRSRFLDCTRLYDHELRAAIADRAAICSAGVYAALPGPSYETPAEIRALSALGADLAGMSTVTEALAAHHMGARVAAISLMTNYAAGLTGMALSHDEVTATARDASDRLIAGVLAAASVLIEIPKPR